MKNSVKISVIITMILLAALTRLVPHWPNFTAIGAMALFGGAILGGRLRSLLVVFAAMFISDLLINNILMAHYYSGFTLFTKGASWVYGAILLMTLFGHLMKKISVMNIIGFSIGGATIFFLLTNFGAWLGNPLYPQTANGLLMSYEAGLPFYLNNIAGTLVYSFALFYAYQYINEKKPAWAVVDHN